MILDKFANNAAQFAGNVSSNANESMNRSMAAKAPKSRMYGKSGSLAIRQGLAVSNKNEGATFVSNVNFDLKLSPGTNTIKRNERLEKCSKLRNKKTHTIEF